ncbi:MAG TPA: glycosyltransferase [bacterium]|nr:glycosyltransferase [bacterium]
MPTREMSERARVLLLIKGLGIGGAERLLEAALPCLNRDRYAYRVAYMLPWKRALVPSFEAAGIPVHDLNMRVPGDPRAFMRLVRLVRRERIDLIHAHLPMAGVWARIAARLGGVPHVVYTEHNVPQRYALPMRVLNRRTYKMNDIVIAVSDEVRRGVEGYANGRPQIVTVANAVDSDALAALPSAPDAMRREFGFPADAVVIVTVGNLTPKKGHTHLLAAAVKVAARHPAARFLIVGQGPQADALRVEAGRLGLNGRLVFAGFRPDAVRLVAASDIFVLSSIFEGLPVALLEAMALGKPSVVTRVGGIPEATDEASSLLVPAEDPQALAEAVGALLESADLRLRMGAAAQERARRRYGVAQMVAAIEQVYADLLWGQRS